MELIEPTKSHSAAFQASFASDTTKRGDPRERPHRPAKTTTAAGKLRSEKTFDGKRHQPKFGEKMPGCSVLYS